MRSPELYGLSFHSPLAIKLLVPTQYQAVYLAHDWSGANLKKNVEPTVQKALQSKRPMLLLCGNLTVLQQFIRDYPDLPQYKVLLFDFPGVIVPFEDPLIDWLDCDHQAGGAWQTSKIKTERFGEDLEKLSFLGPDGKNLVSRMKRFCPRDSRVSEIDHFAEMFSEGLPKDYKDLLNTNFSEHATTEEPDIEIDWRSQTFEQILREILRCFDDNTLKQKILTQALAYQTGKISKREFTTTTNKWLAGKEAYKKILTVLKKWVEDKKLGRALYTRYLDYLANAEKRSWDRIVSEGKIAVAERDLLLLIGFQPRTAELISAYKEEIKTVEDLAADPEPPKKIYQIGEELSFHPPTIDAKTVCF